MWPYLCGIIWSLPGFNLWTVLMLYCIVKCPGHNLTSMLELIFSRLIMKSDCPIRQSPYSSCLPSPLYCEMLFRWNFSPTAFLVLLLLPQFTSCPWAVSLHAACSLASTAVFGFSIMQPIAYLVHICCDLLQCTGTSCLEQLEQFCCPFIATPLLPLHYTPFKEQIIK